MKAFHLAPLIGVSYWHNTPAGIMSARGPIVADFAIVMIVAGHIETSARFELPADRAALDAFLGAVNVAYSLGRHDGINSVRRGLAFEVMPESSLKITERCAHDRD